MKKMDIITAKYDLPEKLEKKQRIHQMESLTNLRMIHSLCAEMIEIFAIVSTNCCCCHFVFD